MELKKRDAGDKSGMPERFCKVAQENIVKK